MHESEKNHRKKFIPPLHEAAGGRLENLCVVVEEADGLVKLLDLPVLQEDLCLANLPAADARHVQHGAARASIRDDAGARAVGENAKADKKERRESACV